MFVHYSTYALTMNNTLRSPSVIDVSLKEGTILFILILVQFFLCYPDDRLVHRPFSVSKACLRSTIVVYHPSGWRDRKNEHKKKGDSFSPYQLGKAMLCPCNWVGISSINCATLDNKYRVHRQLLWDLRRGCVKEWVCVGVILCGCMHICVGGEN